MCRVSDEFLRLPRRRGEDQAFQLVRAPTGVQPIGNVPVLSEPGQCDDTHFICDAMEHRGDLLAVGTARPVIVGQDRDLRAREVVGELWEKLRSSASVRRCDEPFANESVNVFLSFGNDDPTSGLHAGKQLREAVGNASHIVELPCPAAGTVRATLPKCLGRVADNLEEKVAILVHVVVGPDDLRPAVGLRRLAEKVVPAKIRCDEHRFQSATGMADDDHPTLASLGDRQARGAVIMRRAWHRPSGPRAAFATLADVRGDLVSGHRSASTRWRSM